MGSRSFVLDMLPKESVGAEIGVHLGKFSTEILRVVRPSSLHLIDPWKHETGDEYSKAWYGGTVKAGQGGMDTRFEGVCRRFRSQILAGIVVLHRSSSEAALGGMADNSLDWIYIDGNHHYEFVKTDLELSMRKVRPGGLITGDDYQEGGFWEGGVVKAVDELVGSGVVEVIAIQDFQYILKRL